MAPSQTPYRSAVAGLSPERRQALRRALAARSLIAVPVRPTLVAYWCASGGEAPSGDELGAFLADRLPDYMRPRRFERLETLPRLPGGKLDRRALPAPAEPEPSAFCPPRNDIEQTLATIWQEALGLDRISVFDDFFEVGGDSLISIRVLARARRAGLAISPEAFFDDPTIAALVTRLEARDTQDPPALGQADVSPATAPLTPIQHWFFDNVALHQHQWNQSVLLAVPDDLDIAALTAIVRALVGRHDALRLGFERTARQAWQQVFARAGDTLPVRHEDVATLTDTQRTLAMASVAADVHASLSFLPGDLVRFVLFGTPPREENLLLIVVHHLAVDAVSWGLLLEDLDALYRRHGGESGSLASSTVSSSRWATRLMGRATEFLGDVGYWLDLPGRAEDGVPFDRPYVEARNLAGLAQVHAVEAEASFARFSSSVEGGAGRARVVEIVLSALLLAWADWSGRARLRIDLEHHGRDVLADDLDVSRTVGWFTTVFPVVLSVDDEDATAGEDLARLVQGVARQIRAVEPRGAAHGIVRYLAAPSEVSATLARAPRPLVLFNYLGRRGALLPTDSPLRVVTESYGPDRHPLGRRAYAIEINSHVTREHAEHDREAPARDRLHIDIEYQPEFHDPSTIARLGDLLVQNLRRLAAVSARGRDVATDLSGLGSEGLETVARLLAERDAQTE